jgi:hypothetical protein
LSKAPIAMPIVSLDEPQRGSASLSLVGACAPIEAGLGLASQLRGTALASPSQGSIDHKKEQIFGRLFSMT